MDACLVLEEIKKLKFSSTEVAFIQNVLVVIIFLTHAI